MSSRSDINKIDEMSILKMLRSSGYLPFLTEDELTIFNSLYEDNQFKLGDVKIDPDEIMEGSFIKGRREIKLETGENKTEISNLSMAARKGQQISEELLDKLKRKHRDLGKDNDK